MQFKIGDEVREHMAASGLREDAVRYAAERPAIETTQEFDDGEVVILVSHDPDNRRLRMIFTKDRTWLLQVRPVD